ncbi:uncharacterized protein DUF3348 [Paucimonas lemoignei]|uniref:Uncharacterized protein DUF3348 n=2 Tax=Paucimonas lemoignei TaxID=29443 RepID=A0A4R3HW62_PAULE|nr:uncharacterized protein DUF3348 [Paucimonas lemoignei]
MLTRTKFHSSQLIRCLADLDILDAADSGNAFAETLGSWIHFADAITLSAVHSSSTDGSLKALPKLHQEEHAGACAAASAEFNRIQTLLVDSVKKSCSPNPGKSHIKLPAPDVDLPADFKNAYAPYRRFYEAHQRDMELSIQPLRFNVRAALAKTSPQLKKLAELDAVLEKIFHDRERHLLSKVPVLLKTRFDQLFKEHQQKLADMQQADNPAGWMKPGAWLARFCNDMQMLLLAEVELRLQPTMGLVESFKQEPQ